MKLYFRKIGLKFGLFASIVVVLALLSNHTVGAQTGGKTGGTAETLASQWADLTAQVQQNGKVNVIVSIKAPAFDAAVNNNRATNQADAKANAKATGAAEMALASQARAGLLSALSAFHAKVYAGADWFIPAVALTVDQAALNHLYSSPLVQAISPDHQNFLMDNSSVDQIGAPFMWYGAPTVPPGYNGTGQVVAILDTGVQDTHPFLTTNGSTSRIIASTAGCFSGDGAATTPPLYSNCPGDVASVTGAAIDGEPCYNYPGYSGCEHGTHVAGIAAGYGAWSGATGRLANEYGVAWGANIMPVQVFTCFWNGSTCLESAYDTDIIGGLNWVHTEWVGSPYFISSVNMSLGITGSNYPTACDSVDSAMTSAINTLRNSDAIATVIAAGNDGFTNGISYPACISSAVSVGAVNFQDGIAAFSDSGPNMTIFAPGVNVLSSIPTNSSAFLSGTSMATPQVVGSLALLEQETGHTLSVTQLVSIMSKTGRLLYNSGNGLNQPRLNISQAGIVALQRRDTIGIYRNHTFYLRNTNTTGVADQTLAFGDGGTDYPIVGDWPGNAFFDEIGVYNRSNGLFTLCSDGSLVTNGACNGTPPSEIKHFVLGNPNDMPIAGRWNPRPTTYSTTTVDGNTVVIIAAYAPTGVGVFRPSNGLLYLKNALTTGFADFTMVLGIPGDIGMGGDWNQDGQGSPGVYRPSNAVFYLSNQVCNCSVFADITFAYGTAGTAGDLPVTGNWHTYDNTFVGPGVYRSSTGFYFLRYTLNTGVGNISFYYGISSDVPVVGDWTYITSAPRPHLGLVGQPSPPAILVGPGTENPSQPAGNAPAKTGLGD